MVARKHQANMAKSHPLSNTLAVETFHSPTLATGVTSLKRPDNSSDQGKL